MANETGLPHNLTAIGLMSGTSLDGIDAALIVSDGLAVRSTGETLTVEYDAGLRRRLAGLLGSREASGEIDAVEGEITRANAVAVRALLSKAGLRAGDIHVVGFHGQTILHAPEEGRTWQIGDGALLAAEIGIDVVCDFRAADMKAGGEGAPLAPAFHRALVANLEKPLAVLNIGGVANVTWLGADGGLCAFDTGPGNAMLDDWAASHTGRPVDRDGALASAGNVDEAVLSSLLGHSYFDRPPPKSLDRNAFSAQPLTGLSPADGAATLAEFTAASVARGAGLLPAAPRRWLVSGGGRHNPVLMRRLAARLDARVEPVEAVGWDGDALESQAFAYLALRSLAGLPLSYPNTTGVVRPTLGGRLFSKER